jgi:hypothetical protein
MGLTAFNHPISRLTCPRATGSLRRFVPQAGFRSALVQQMPGSVSALENLSLQLRIIIFKVLTVKSLLHLGGTCRAFRDAIPEDVWQYVAEGKYMEDRPLQQSHKRGRHDSTSEHVLRDLGAGHRPEVGRRSCGRAWYLVQCRRQVHHFRSTPASLVSGCMPPRPCS